MDKKNVHREQIGAGWINPDKKNKKKSDENDVLISDDLGQAKYNDENISDFNSKIASIVNSLHDKFGNTVFGDAISGFYLTYKKNKKILIYILIASLILACRLSYKLSGFLFPNKGFSGTVKIMLAMSPLILILFFLFNFVSWAICQVIYKNSSHDEERDYDMSKTGTYGTAHWINKAPEEFYQTFNTKKDINRIKDDILGMYKEENDKLVSLRNDLKGLNKNLLVVGSPGCGKSAAYVINKVFQCIRRGESCVITDSKGAIYAETAKQAKDEGYLTKVLNLTPQGLIHSDSCSLLRYVGKDISRIMQLAKTIIRNTTDGKKNDPYADPEYNLLLAALTYVIYSDTIPEEKKTLGYAYSNIITKPESELENIFGVLPKDHPAYDPYIKFANGSDNFRGNTISGLGIRLGILSNPIIQNIVGYDDIDLLAPGKQKCIYYVIIPDQDDTFNFIATMFFSLLFINLVEDADGRVETGMSLPVPVNIVLDEFFSTGAIEGFEKKIATVRSRGISIAIILQDLGQLIEMYGENIANSIMGGCSIKMLLATNDQGTADYFSKDLGTQTIFMKNKRYTESSFDLFKIHPNYQLTEGLGKRFLMNPDEIKNSLSSDELIIIVSGRHPAKLKKYFFQNHPMYNSDNSTKLNPNDNYPLWKQDKDKQENSRKEEAEKIRKKAEEMKQRIKGKNVHSEQNNNKLLKKKITKIKRIHPDGHYEIINKETGELLGVYNKDGTLRKTRRNKNAQN